MSGALGMCVGRSPDLHISETKVSGESGVALFCVSPGQISNLCAEEAAAQEQTGQVEECLKVNLLKIKTDMCKRVTAIITSPTCFSLLFPLFSLMLYSACFSDKI